MTPHRLRQELTFFETLERNSFPWSWQRRRSAPKIECFLMLRKPLLVRLCVVAWVLYSVSSIFYRAIFVWPWNENARTKQKQQTNGNSAIWSVYWTDTNAGGFSLVKRTLRWKNLHAREPSRINRYYALPSYCNTIGRETKNPCFDLFIHWLIKQITNTYRNHFSRSYENRSITSFGDCTRLQHQEVPQNMQNSFTCGRRMWCVSQMQRRTEEPQWLVRQELMVRNVSAHWRLIKHC